MPSTITVGGIFILGKKSFQGSRIPLPESSIQVNFCKNPACTNYGVPASTQKQPKGRGAGVKDRDNYTIVGSGKNSPTIKCGVCNEHPPIKSNHGIAEELDRIAAYLEPEAEACCPDMSCLNHGVGVSTGKTAYQSFGKTKSGSQRYLCKVCGKSFSVGKATVRQKQPHKNKLIFKLLMNKMPLRRISEVADIQMPGIYAKIDFLHRQCMAFVGERERRLLAGKAAQRFYVSVDRQDYIVNWARRADKRNVQLSAVGSADNATGYVFGMHLNYDPSLDSTMVEADAVANGDYSLQPPHRRYAHLWLKGDYDVSMQRMIKRRNASCLGSEIEAEYDCAGQREDVEATEEQSMDRCLPSMGMQTHSEYTLYAHFFLLHKMFGGVEKVRFFLDQDSGMRAACLAAFQSEIARRTCDAFYVRINKGMTVDEKRHALSDSRQQFKATQVAHPALTESEVKLLLIKQRMAGMTEIGQWKDKWLKHPFPNMSEPEKAICYLIDYGDYDEDHRAWLYNKASMHSIDCFFMQVRRRLSLLERPIKTASKSGRTWYGYSPYNPAMIIKLLDILRVYFNYCLLGDDKQTPAMRLGLAKGRVTEEDIIYYG